MTIDNESPPGAWKNEMARMSWGFGQSQSKTVQDVIVVMRKTGLWDEANLIDMEFTALKAEIERLRGEKK